MKHSQAWHRLRQINYKLSLSPCICDLLPTIMPQILWPYNERTVNTLPYNIEIMQNVTALGKHLKTKSFSSKLKDLYPLKYFKQPHTRHWRNCFSMLLCKLLSKVVKWLKNRNSLSMTFDNSLILSFDSSQITLLRHIFSCLTKRFYRGP